MQAIRARLRHPQDPLLRPAGQLARRSGRRSATCWCSGNLIYRMVGLPHADAR